MADILIGARNAMAPLSGTLIRFLKLFSHQPPWPLCPSLCPSLCPLSVRDKDSSKESSKEIVNAYIHLA